MAPSIEFVDSVPDSWGVYNRGSLVHMCFDIEVEKGTVSASMRLMYENITKRDLENATFKVRLPNDAHVSLAECEVERELGIRLGPLDKRLEKRQMKNIGTEGSFFKFSIGKVGVKKDIIIYVKYTFCLRQVGDVIHMSLPLPARHLPSEKSYPHHCGVTFEPQFPVVFTQVSSSSHQITTTLKDCKFRVDVFDALAHGDLDLAIMTSEFLPPIPRRNFETYSNSEVMGDSALSRRMAVEAPPSLIPTATAYASRETSGVSSHTFFLTDSETDSEMDTEYYYQNPLNGSNPEANGHQDVPCLNENPKWFEFGGYFPQTPHEPDPSFNSEGQWLSGSHPTYHSTTSWLAEDADYEHDGWHNAKPTTPNEVYDLMDVSQGYTGAALATASMIISNDRPRLIEIPQRSGHSNVPTVQNNNPCYFHSDFTPNPPATPPPTPEHGELSSTAVGSVDLADKLWGLDNNYDMPEWYEVASAPTSSRAGAAAAAAAGNGSNMGLPAHALGTTPPQPPIFFYGWV